MTHTLPNLPFEKNALEPAISAETLEYHYGRHHKGYVEKLNHLIVGTVFENKSLDEILLHSSGPIFNNAGQVWNHNFLWNCLIPKGLVSNGELMTHLQKTYGSLDGFFKKFNTIALETFGSGWTWLAFNPKDHSLSIESTSNAENPLRYGRIPLLTCDVWEHAYYIDYKNERSRFLENITKVTNWEFAEKNYQAAKQTSIAA